MLGIYECIPSSLPPRLRKDLPPAEQAKMLATLAMLRADDRALANLGPAEEAIIARWYSAAADTVEARYGKPLPRNTDGMPLLFFPPGTRTREILRVSVHAAARAVTKCAAGARNIRKRGKVFEEWVPGGSWRIIVTWINHVARIGCRDDLTGLDFDCTGRRHSLRKPCLAAHQTHDRPLFANVGPPRPEVFDDAATNRLLTASNCTIQSHYTNFLIGSRSVHEIMQIVETLAPAVWEILERLRVVGVMDGVTDEDMKARPVRLRPETLERLEDLLSLDIVILKPKSSSRQLSRRGSQGLLDVRKTRGDTRKCSTGKAQAPAALAPLGSEEPRHTVTPRADCQAATWLWPARLGVGQCSFAAKTAPPV